MQRVLVPNRPWPANQRSSRDQDSNEPSRSLPRPASGRLRSVMHVLYLLFNREASRSGPNLARTDLSAGLRLRRLIPLRARDPDSPVCWPDASYDARRPARTARRRCPSPTGPQPLGPLADHDGAHYHDRAPAGRMGNPSTSLYRLAFTISPHESDTNWGETWPVQRAERITGNPGKLTRAVARHGHGPTWDSSLDGRDERLCDHHRLPRRAHLLELSATHPARLPSSRRRSRRRTCASSTTSPLRPPAGDRMAED